ncbi:MAG: four helix bundle protein [Vicinamibacterales bacterium]
MARINSYRELEVWQMSMALARACYAFTRSMPKDELYGLTSQIRRAAVSIPANVAEGHNRRSRRAYRYHVSVALGSQAELGTLLELAAELKPAAPCGLSDMGPILERVGMMLHALARALEPENDEPDDRRPPNPDRR